MIEKIRVGSKRKWILHILRGIGLVTMVSEGSVEEGMKKRGTRRFKLPVDIQCAVSCLGPVNGRLLCIDVITSYGVTV